MFDTFRNAWRSPELRKKLLYTLLVIVIFRIGAAITVPYLNLTALHNEITSGGNSLMGYIDILTGGALSRATIFSMSVTPYINATIIIQLLTVAIPALERLSKEGEVGRKKLNSITRVFTMFLGLGQGLGMYFYLLNSHITQYSTGFSAVFAAIVIVAVFTAGSCLMMWLGEQINDKGIGNGISILLFAGIVSRGPSIGSAISKYWSIGGKYHVLIPALIVLGLFVIVAIVFMNDAERRIPVQYAKRVVGRKMYGGQSSYIPIKVTMSGVMPIIFASSIVSIPSIIGGFLPKASTIYKVFTWFGYTSWLYAVVYFVLIILFNFFYVAIQYNPFEISNNLRKNNGGIPGIRPGKPTADFIQRVISRVTLIGAVFLGVVAVLPIALSAGAGLNIALGGTSLLILVGVALDTQRQLESQMMMRHYKGFLE